MNAVLKKFYDYGIRQLDVTATKPVDQDGKIINLHPASDINKTVRFGVISILLVFGGLGAWAAFAPLSGAVIGTGFIKVDSNRKTVQHLEGGIVKEIRVRDGDYVKSGQVLIVIEDENVSAGVDMLQGRLDALSIRAARLDAERSEQSAPTFSQDILERSQQAEIAKMLKDETAYFETRLRTYLEQVDMLKKQALEAENELQGLNSQVQATRAALQLIEQEVAATGELEKQKFVQKFEFLSLKRGVEDYRTRLGEYISEVSRTRQKILDLNLRIAGLRNNYVTTAAQELTEVNASIYDLRERLRPTLDAKNRQNIVAPISGTVVDMQIFTVGGVIAPRDKLLDIVQDNGVLIVETRITVDSIESVQSGQQADIRLSAYSSRDIPLISGKVTYVSADRLEDKRNGSAYYVAHIDLDKESLANAGEGVHLYPGMPAEVFIKTGSRTALDYLMSPITNSLRRSAREP